MSETAYPLQWPVAWKRTPRQSRSIGRFENRWNATTWTIDRARRELAAELERLGAEDPILSTNLRLRLDGQPQSNQAQPSDTGVAVYFTLRGRRTVLACDRWIKVEHNIRAIALHVEAIRGMARWGVGNVEQAFTGYAALPERASDPSWRATLQFDSDVPLTVDLVESRFRSLAKTLHPDVPGGSQKLFEELLLARELAFAEFHANQHGGGA